jgi:pyruvate,water dikinase
MARDLGLPAIVGFRAATTQIQTGQILGLDGDQGTLYQFSTLEQATTLQAQWSKTRSPLSSPPLSDSAAPHPEALRLGNETPSISAGKTLNSPTQIWATLSQSNTLHAIQELPVTGLGLLRAEWLMIEALDRQHPQQWIQQGQPAELTARLTDHLQPFAAAFEPRPVFYRALDGHSHDLAALTGGKAFEVPEPNPILGLRGTARYLHHPEVFECELAALATLYRRGHSNLRLLLPFVRSVEEFRWCQGRIAAAGLRQYPNFEVWVMVEVPSMLFLLPEYVAAGAQGIAIGSNDFTQLILGVDREQPLLADGFDATHPAVRAAIVQVITTARDLGIPCSICGQAPVHHPHLIEEWMAAGITAIVVDRQSVTATQQAVDRAEQRLLFPELRQQSLDSDPKTAASLR